MPNDRQFAGSSSSLHSFHFQAMNTRVELSLLCHPEAAERLERLAVQWFEQTEDRFSRFRPQSELCHLNRLAGERCMVSDAMMEVLLLADKYRELTGGVFDPLILGGLHAAGYAESFDSVRMSGEAVAAEPAPAADRAGAIVLNPVMKSVVLPAGAKIDLGGIVKSWAVRRLAVFFQNELSVKRGFINAGGDLTAWGAEDGDPWRIGVEHPWQTEHEAGVLAITSGAAATSSKLGRQWNTSLGPRHHLIDPRTMLPSDSDVAQCTVYGKDLVACEVWAKVICILGLDQGLALFGQKASGCEALAFTHNRQTHLHMAPSSSDNRWRNVRCDHIYMPPAGAEIAF